MSMIHFESDHAEDAGEGGILEAPDEVCEGLNVAMQPSRTMTASRIQVIQ